MNELPSFEQLLKMSHKEKVAVLRANPEYKERVRREMHERLAAKGFRIEVHEDVGDANNPALIVKILPATPGADAEE